MKNGRHFSILCPVLLVAFLIPGKAAAGIGEDFNWASQLYEKGSYAEAAGACQKIIDQGAVSSALLFNLGNARFKAGKTGLAVAAYRQAEDLAPRDPDIRANLRFVRDQVKASRLSPAPWWRRWAFSLTLNEWSVLFSIAAAAWFVLLGLRTWNSALEAASSGYTAALAVIALGLAAGLGLAADRQLIEKTSVVVLPEAVIRRGPYADSQSYYTAPDGTEFIVIEERSGWVEVMDGAGRTGWAPRDEMAILPGGV
jgi:tetratricopeptide (TPR) repeat protein